MTASLSNNFDINIVGRNIRTGDALPDHVDSHLRSVLEKYWPRSGKVDVTFRHEGNGYRCDCIVRSDSGTKLQSSSEAIDIYSSFNAAVARLEKQLRRHSRRLKEHHKKKEQPSLLEPFEGFIVRQAEELENDANLNGKEAEDTNTANEPLIIAEQLQSLPELSVGNAAIEMDMSGSHVRVFRNAANGAVNIVFQRDDGNIGWFDLSRLKK